MDWRGRVSLLFFVCQCFASDESCQDTLAWSNGHGYDCASYANGWCSGGAAIAGQEWTLGSQFNYPEQNCCMCGKPTSEGAYQDVLVVDIGVGTTDINTIRAYCPEGRRLVSLVDAGHIQYLKEALQTQKGDSYFTSGQGTALGYMYNNDHRVYDLNDPSRDLSQIFQDAMNQGIIDYNEADPSQYADQPWAGFGWGGTTQIHDYSTHTTRAAFCESVPGGEEESLSSLAQNNFNDRGGTTLSASVTYTYTLEHGYPCALSGWTHTRNYAKGFLRNEAGDALAVVSGLSPGAEYRYKVYQFASSYAGTNPLSINGGAPISTTSAESDAATAEGIAMATTAGTIEFKFSRITHHVHLSGIAIGAIDPTASDSSRFCDGISSSQIVTKGGITAYCDADTFPGESWAVVWTSTKDHAVSNFDNFWASLHQPSNTIPIPSQSSAEGSAYDLLCPSAQQCRLALVCEGTDGVTRWMKWSQGTDGSRLVSPSNELNSCAEQGGGITCDYSYTNFGELEESSGFSGTPAHAVFRENPNTGYRYRWGMGTGTWDVLFGVDINDGEYDCGGSQARWWAVEIYGGAPIDESDMRTVDLSDAFEGDRGVKPECGACNQDTYDGQGFLLYHDDDIRSSSRFTSAHKSGSYLKVHGVKYESGQWYYDTNSAWKTFTPEETDVLIAEIDYSADTCSILNSESMYEGIHKGVLNTDMECRGNQRYANAGSGSNEGEFYVQGTYFVVSQIIECTLSNTVGCVQGDVAIFEATRQGDNTQGLLLVWYEENWGTICDDVTDCNCSDGGCTSGCSNSLVNGVGGQNLARVACQSMGLSGGEEINADGSSSGYDIVIDGTQNHITGCNGDEAHISECNWLHYGSHNCGHNEDVGVICGPGMSVPASTTTSLPSLAPATSLPSLAPTMPTCNAFLLCGDDASHIPNAVTIHGNDFESCCRCQFGLNLLWGAHANGTFHQDSNKVEVWFEVPADVDMQRISWEDAQNDDLGNWQFRNGSSECRAQYALVQDLNTFFGAASHFTYDRSQDVLEGMFDFEADRSIYRSIGGHRSSFVQHIEQDIPVLFSLEKTATVEATFSTQSGPQFADIAITGIAENTFSEDGEIVLNFNILSSSCMAQSVTLKTGSQFVSGDLTVTWSDESLWHPSGLSDASCSQDVTVQFHKADEIYDLALVFQFEIQMIQGADDDDKYIETTVNLHIEKPSILDSLPIQAQMSFYTGADRISTADSYGLGHTVYGRVVTTTVVSVDDIDITSLALRQLGYDNEWNTHDILNVWWSGYQGSYISPNHFDFSFVLNTTELHITASDGGDEHLASIVADIEVSYLDGSSTNDRRRLAIGADADSSMETSGSFRITEENTAAVQLILNTSSANKVRALQWATFGALIVGVCYLKRRMKSKDEVYSPLMLDDEI